MSIPDSVVRWDDPDAFTHKVLPFVLRDEVANCLMVAILSGPGFQSEYLVTAGDNGIRGAAFLTPLKLLPSVMNEATARTLAADAYRAIPGLNEVLGPRPAVDAFAAAWSSLSGIAARRGRAERIYQLESVKPIAGVPGRMRLIRHDEFTIVVPWIGAMGRATGDRIEPSMAEEMFDRHLERQTLSLWDDSGPVSMAAVATRTPNTRRISLVYAPREQRRQGYASALVAAISQQVLDFGTRWCVLYTDLANPTTNHIYQEIGYRSVCDAQEYLLGARPEA